MHVIVRRDSGREFQIVGPETQNALSPNLVLVLGIMKSVVSAERSLMYGMGRYSKVHEYENIAGFGKSVYLVREGEMFVECET